MSESAPAQVFHPGEYLRDELDARGWSADKMACEMPGDPRLNLLIVEFMLAALESPPEHAIQDMRIGISEAVAISAALGTSPELWLNLDKSWNTWRDKRCWPEPQGDDQ